MLQNFSSVTELVSASLRPGLLLEHHDSGFVQVDRQSPFLTVLFQQGQAVLETLGCGGHQNQVVRIQQAFDFGVVQSDARDVAGAVQSFCQLVDVDVEQGWAQTASRLTPRPCWKNAVLQLPILTAHRLFLYMDCITSNVFPPMPICNNLYSNPSCQTESKAFFKSTNM